MKNLLLPFVVVALFALGSCGDEAVQPNVQQPIESRPVKITSFTPDTALRGKRVIITGDNFSAFKDSNSVLLLNEWNRTFLLHVDSISPAIHPTQLFVSVSNDVSDFWQRSRIIVTTGTSSDTTQKKLFLKDDIVIEDTTNNQDTNQAYFVAKHWESLTVENAVFLVHQKSDKFFGDYDTTRTQAIPSLTRTLPLIKREQAGDSIVFSYGENFQQDRDTRGSNQSITIKLDYEQKRAHSIMIRTRSYNYPFLPNGSPYGDQNFALYLEDVPFTIKDSTFLIDVSGEKLNQALKKIEYSYKYGSGNTQTSYGSINVSFVSLLPFENTSRLRIVLKVG